jgi:predicted PurR-regulated permease PerM
VLAYVMRPIKDRVQAFGVGRIAATVVAFVFFFGMLGILLTYLLPFIAEQISAVSGQLSPVAVSATIADGLARFAPVDPAVVQQTILDGLNTLLEEDRLTDMAGSVLDLFTNVFYAILVVPFVAFFFLKDGHRLRASALSLVPNRYFEVTLGILGKVETNIGRYFKAIAFQGLSVATVATIALSIAGLQYSLAIGFFVGLANTIPYFGPIIGIVAGSLVGISQTGDFSLIPGVLIAMVITQISDNAFFQPMIFARAARAHPLVILFVVLIGAQVAGIVGMLIAIPLVTTVRVVGTEVYWSIRRYRVLVTPAVP